MDTATKGAAKRLIISLLPLMLLAGCAAVPYEPYPDYPPYSSYPYGQGAYVGPPIYTGPEVIFGFGFHGGEGHRGHHEGRHDGHHHGHPDGHHEGHHEGRHWEHGQHDR